MIFLLYLFDFLLYIEADKIRDGFLYKDETGEQNALGKIIEEVAKVKKFSRKEKKKWR